MPQLPPLHLPPFDFKLKKEGEILKIYDSLRAKYVAATPEEYVRQHFINYLIHFMHYPASHIANEIGIELNGTKKRCDSVVFGNDMLPLMIIEYKAPNVEITQVTFDQIARYNMRLKAKYLIVSNGMQHFCCVMDYDKDTYHFLPRIPEFTSLVNPFSEN
ncbi:MAG: type I restriction enzyme HsdR N-terminal domain-containing protein [Muribaculaceae bacterium]|nr:type I restriction enzyme HsdR N-terminal domain-containing protein [Muribaculaceae bacterium]